MTVADGSDRIAWALTALTGDEVLDVGCGTGETALALARAGRQVSGADRRPDSVRAARDALFAESDDVRSRTRFLVVEGPLPFGDACFDAALLEDPDPADGLTGLLLELRRVVRPGGAIAAWAAPEAMPRVLEAVEPLLEVEGEDRLGDAAVVLLRTPRDPDAERDGSPLELLRAAMRDDQRTIARLESDRDRLAGELRAERRRADQGEARLGEVEALEGEAARLREHLSATRADAAAERERTAEAVGERDRLRSEAARAGQELERLRERLDTEAREREVISRRVSVQTARANEARGEEERVRRRLARVQEKHDRKEAQLDSIRSSRAFRLTRASWWLSRTIQRPFRRGGR